MSKKPRRRKRDARWPRMTITAASQRIHLGLGIYYDPAKARKMAQGLRKNREWERDFS